MYVLSTGVIDLVFGTDLSPVQAGILGVTGMVYGVFKDHFYGLPKFRERIEKERVKIMHEKLTAGETIDVEFQEVENQEVKN